MQMGRQETPLKAIASDKLFAKFVLVRRIGQMHQVFDQ
jgi:hypothetical protein